MREERRWGGTGWGDMRWVGRLVVWLQPAPADAWRRTSARRKRGGVRVVGHGVGGALPAARGGRGQGTRVEARGGRRGEGGRAGASKCPAPLCKGAKGAGFNESKRPLRPAWGCAVDRCARAGTARHLSKGGDNFGAAALPYPSHSSAMARLRVHRGGGGRRDDRTTDGGSVRPVLERGGAGGRPAPLRAAEGRSEKCAC